MAIVSIVELVRQGTHQLGATPVFVRTFRVELTAPLGAAAVTALCGVQHGAPHPEFAECRCVNIEVNEEIIEASAQAPGENPATIAVTVVANYEVFEAPDLEILPWNRQPVWGFQTQGVAVPALFYFDGETKKPLTNSAGDYFEGLLADEAQQKVTINSNRQTFPSALAAAVTNCVNDSSYLGFAPDCVKVQGISGERVAEQINGQEVRYWKVTSELLCRQTGWNLLLPDIGFNFIEDGVKKRGTVEGPDGDQIPSANPIGLNGNGGKANFPAILDRRVYTRINMALFFGTPPT
jgi:hypothetical protein